MSRADRGGLTLKTGKIGRVNCLRQQLLMPGERMNVGINGSVRLETLRERDVMRINAHLACFMTPVRWLMSDWPDYVKEGDATLITPGLSSALDWSQFGIGCYESSPTSNYWDVFEDNILRVYNEWYKWPDRADVTTLEADGHGPRAVPLAKAWNRARSSASPSDAGDYLVSSGSNFDVRDLAEMQARFRGAMKRDVLSYNRWMELINDVWKGDGSREVDQVPIMLDQVEVGVNPREMPATDGASLGQWQSMFDFAVNHDINGIVAPEHCIISYFLVVRFASVLEGIMPLAKTQNMDWFETVGDPEYLSSAAPTEVTLSDVMRTTSATSLGYLPAGWRWRCGHDVIGKAIDIRDSFPYMLQPSTSDEAKDASRVKDAFRSQALDDYMVDIYFDEKTVQPIGDSMDSYMSGMMDHAKPSPGGRNEEFPAGGKML